MAMRVGVFISGRGSNMLALLKGAKHYEIAVVIAHNAGAKGLEEAKNRGVKTEVVARDDKALEQALIKHKCNFAVLAGYMRILGKDFVEAWEGRLVNIHPSLLPKYKGLNTHARVLEAGESQHGCSVHWVSEMLDAGKVIKRRALRVRQDHTVESLAKDVLALEHSLLPEVVNELAYKQASNAKPAKEKRILEKLTANLSDAEDTVFKEVGRVG